MAFHLDGFPAALLALIILILPAVIIASYFSSVVWAVLWPVGLIASLLLLGIVSPRRKVTPQQFADELERHLLGTEGPWDWDDTTSIRIADKRLDAVRCKMSKFDSFALPEWKQEFSEIIAALRRGEIPNVKDDY